MPSLIGCEALWQNGQTVTTMFIILITFVGVVFKFLQWHEGHDSLLSFNKKAKLLGRLSCTPSRLEAQHLPSLNDIRTIFT